MFVNKTRRWIDALPKLVASHNRTFHSRIKMAPDDVTNWPSIFKARANLYKTTPYEDATKLITFKFQIGDRVLIATKQSHYSKAYRGIFIPQVYIVINRYRRNGFPIYKLKDTKNIYIKGSFYEPELIRAPPK